MSFEVVTTRGGARAVLDRETGEVMHPVVGPRVEAQQLYVGPSRLEARLAIPGQAPLVLLDVGLGAGSNAIAAWSASERASDGGRRLEIVSFDRTLGALALALDHPTDFGLEGGAGIAARALCERGLHETARTRWRFVAGELPASLADLDDGSADVVFWDPFSPKASPELWELRAFAALRRACGPGCTVHTYSGATATRSALLLAGFAVGLGEPTGTEKHGTCAATSIEDLAAPLDARWLERVRRSSAPLPRDAPPDAMDRLGRIAQLAR